MNERPIIYQVFTRLFGAEGKHPTPNGNIRQNGCGKMNDLTDEVLADIRDLGCNYIWTTGVIEHAQQTDHSAYGIIKDNPAVVKGRAGSPYAIKDYYDIDPDLAVSVPDRLKEFDQIVLDLLVAFRLLISVDVVGVCVVTPVLDADAYGRFC